MEDVEEDGPSTGGVQAAVSQTVMNVPKRYRCDGDDESQNIDVSALRYDPNNQNRFGLLAGLEIENNKPDNTNNPDSTNKPDNTKVGKEPNTRKNSFCPPIFIYNVNIKHLVAQLEAKTPKINFKIKNISKEKSKIYFADAMVHANMMALLRESGVQSYSFTPKEFKQMSLILRGLCYGLDPEEVKAALDLAVPEVVARVTKFTTSYSMKNKTDTGLFLITLFPDKGLSDVAHVKYLLSQTIVWEKPKKKEEEIQCHRCQRWGHVSRNCNAQFKCVKCDQTHKPGECQRQRTDSSDPHCVNCGVAGHTANWKGCPTFKKHQASRKERLLKAREVRENAMSNVNKLINSGLRSPGKTFASLFKTQQPHISVQMKKPSIIEEFLKLANYFLEPEELSLEQEINIFLANFQTLSKTDAKGEFVRLFNKVKSSYGP